jgi:uncharacterized protein
VSAGGPFSDREPSRPWYGLGLRFGCAQCGHCCGGAPGYVWVADAEIAPIAAALNIAPSAFVQRHLRLVRGQQSLRELSNGDCEFLRRAPDGRAGCAIYVARPRQCRTWPFWDCNLESPQAWAGAARGCPGMDRGRLHPLPVIQAALDAPGAPAARAFAI